MKKFKDFKLAVQLLVAFVPAIVTILCITAFGAVNLITQADGMSREVSTLSSTLGPIYKLSSSYSDVINNVENINLCTDTAQIQTYTDIIKKEITAIDGYISDIKTIYKDNPQAPINQYAVEAQAFGALLDQFIAAPEDEKSSYVAELITKEGAIQASGQDMLNSNLTSISTLAENNKASALQNVLLEVAFNIIFAALAALLVIKIGRLMNDPIRQMSVTTAEMAQGKLNVNIGHNSLSETGVLAKGLREMASVLNRLIDDMHNMTNAHSEGRIDVFINADEYEGSYKDVAMGINSMVGAYITDTKSAFKAVSEIGDGNFTYSIADFPGDKIFMNESINEIKLNLLDINEEISTLVHSTVEGKLSVRGDLKKFHGGWLSLVDGLNHLLDAIILPVSEAQQVLKIIEAGDLDARVTGEYKGDHAAIKNSMNNTFDTISSYINEMSGILEEMSYKNVSQMIEREYFGSFRKMKESLNTTVASFNSVLRDINSSSGEVASAAMQISSVSQGLAQGSTEQASSAQELSAAIEQVYDKTKGNTENAEKAAALATKAKANAEQGNAEMKNMLSAMDEITVSSNAISDILKVINDIAFQTNILALNASIEAARAGQYGKTFSVVAGEVGGLSKKTQAAAQETADLIEKSKGKVEQGLKIANKTSHMLNDILSEVTLVSDIVEIISDASGQQAAAISQINDGMSQITLVIQDNTAKSEEAASASEELSSQSEVLNAMVNEFTLLS